MSLVRAFTIRRARSGKSGIDRSGSQKSLRPKISGPVALLSTTNTLAYEAPDIAGTNPVMYQGHRGHLATSVSSRSLSSVEDSDGSSVGHRSGGTFTDASSFEDSPSSPEPNHLSCYFKPSVYDESPHGRKDSVSSARRPSTSTDAPSIPQRAPSHSKNAHVHMARKRSVSRFTPPSFPEEHIVTARDSADLFRHSGQSSPGLGIFHPFGKELEQLSEVVEEFGTVTRDAEADADRVFMEAHGLGSFCAADYMAEIQHLLSDIFEEEQAAVEEGGWF